MKYWMAIYNPDTWREFVAMPDKVCAFTENRTRRFPVISIGDKVVCYVARAFTWSGLLTVTGELYRASGVAYPLRVPVKADVLVGDPSLGLPMSKMEGRLSFFPMGGGPKVWAPHVRISPRVMHIPDAEALAEALRQYANSVE